MRCCPESDVGDESSFSTHEGRGDKNEEGRKERLC